MLVVLLSGVVMADTNQKDDSGVQEANVTAGQSLSIGVNSVANEVESEISNIELNNKLQNADSDEERLEIIEEELENLNTEADDLREKYDQSTESVGERRQSGVASDIAHLSSDAKNVQDRLEEIEDSITYLDEDNINIDKINDKVLDVRANTSIVAGENSEVVRKGAMTNGLSVALDARQDQLTVAANASNERVYFGTERAMERGNVTITEDEAVDIARSELTEDAEFKSVDRDRNGDYEVRFEQNDSDRSVTVGSSTGEVRKNVEKRSIPEHARANVPNFVLSGDNGMVGQGPPEHVGQRGPPSWVQERGEAGERGPPEEAGPPFDSGIRDEGSDTNERGSPFAGDNGEQGQSDSSDNGNGKERGK